MLSNSEFFEEGEKHKFQKEISLIATESVLSKVVDEFSEKDSTHDDHHLH